MKKSKLIDVLLYMVIALFICSVTTVVAQNATLTGKVTDDESGETLPGANIVVTSSEIQSGAAAKSNGTYQVKNLSPGTYTVTVSYIGYEKKVLTDIALAAGETKTLDIVLLQVGIEFNPIAITASRRPEKVLEAPASISVLEARDIAIDVSTSSASILRNVTGIDMAQTGIDRREIVMRGFNNAFSGEAYVLTDNRQAQVPSLGINMHNIMPNMNIDLEKIEIVRGPGAALYGAGVDEGVIHYITKDPFNYPGTTLSVSGGQRSSIAGAFRHAGVINNKLGYKITGQYAQANDWELNPKDSLDFTQLKDEAKERDYDYKKLNINGLLQYRLNENTTLTANGGFSNFDGTVLTGIGTAQANGWGYAYGQIRLQANHFFAQAYLNRNNAGDSFVYGDGSLLVDKSTLLNVQAQYDLEMADGKQQFIFGLDYERVTPNTEGTIYGRNEENDLISETGGYVQSQTALSSKFDVTAALRLDYNNLQEELVLSPRVAMVFKPAAGHSFRATFNRAFTSPGATEWFLDIPASITQLSPIHKVIAQGRGSTSGFTFSNFRTNRVATSFIPLPAPFPDIFGQEFPIDTYPVQPVYFFASGIIDSYSDPEKTPTDRLPPALSIYNRGQIKVMSQLLGVIALNTPQTETMTAVLGIPDDSEQLGYRQVSSPVDIDPLKINTTNSFELGYKGLIKDRVLFAVDGYYTNKKNFIGPLLLETPFVYLPVEAIGQDVMTIIGGGLASQDPTITALVGQLGLTPEQAITLLTGLLAQTRSAVVQSDQQILETDNPNEVGALVAYRNFGNVNFWGIDASLQVLATDNLSFFGNMSIVSDDFFDNEELDESNTDLSVALNAPAFKTKFGFNYSVPYGISLNASARYIKGFRVESGLTYQGDVEKYFLLDIGAGYDLGRMAPGMRFDIAVQNVLNNSHREFIGAPKLGRLALARFSYTIR